MHAKVSDDKTLWREREREEEEAGGKLSHPFLSNPSSLPVALVT